MSFSPVARAPGAAAGAGAADRAALRADAGAAPGRLAARGRRIAGPGIAILRAHPGYVRRVHARGHQVYVWTVDEPEDIDLVLASAWTP